MDLFTSFRIAHDGLSAQRTRLNTVAGNLANVNTTRTAEGGPYKRKLPVFEAQPLEEIFPASEELYTGENSPIISVDGEEIDDPYQNHDKVSSVSLAEIQEDDAPNRMVYEPNHPDANNEGYVAYPNVDPVMEMVDLISTSRSYEANVSVIDAIKKMANQAISIGR